MRYFLAIFALCVLATVGVLGFRGSHFRQPPLYVFPDMERQPKLRPQTANAFFDDGLSSRQPVAGTIARTQPIHVGGIDTRDSAAHVLAHGLADLQSNLRGRG